MSGTKKEVRSLGIPFQAGFAVFFRNAEFLVRCLLSAQETEWQAITEHATPLKQA
jgi:hypothetical protein